MLSVSVTTRNPRPDEKEATDYFFKTVEEFQKLKNAKELNNAIDLNK